jgi:hypothetical protein
MTATESNFTDLNETGDTIANGWPNIVPAIKGMLALWRMKEISGVEPSDLLTGLYLSDGTATYAWVIRADGDDLVIEENTGADEKIPGGTWVERAKFTAGTGITINASQVTGGEMDDARIKESNVTQHAGAINHDDLGSIPANDHKDHSNIQVVAGIGLDGGGTIEATRTIDLADTVITPGTYSQANIIVDQQGRLSFAATGGWTPVTYQRTADEAAVAVDTDDSVLTATAYPNGGADGTKVYKVSVTCTYTASTQRDVHLKFWSNSSGNIAGAGTPLITGGDMHNGQEISVSIAEYILTPANSDLWGISHEPSGTTTPLGASGYTAWVTIQRLS